MLDEPVSSLDPLARREFLQGLMEIVADHGVSVILSSHLVADLEQVCDYQRCLDHPSGRYLSPVADMSKCDIRDPKEELEMESPRRQHST